MERAEQHVHESNSGPEQATRPSLEPMIPDFPPSAAMPYVDVWTSVRRHPVLVVVPLILILGGALGIGLHRAPKFSADTHLQIASLNLNEPGALTGFSTATASLASAYSRAIDADAVVLPVARRYHLNPQVVRSRVVATPIPSSPVIKVTATDTSSRGAVTLANAVSRQLVAYVNTLSSANPAVNQLYEQYRKLALALNTAKIRAAEAQHRYLTNKSTSTFTALRDSRTDVQTLQLQANSVQSAYHQVVNGEHAPTTTSLLDNAASASSDRKKKLEVLGLIGLLAGLATGAAVATARANRQARRVLGL